MDNRSWSGPQKKSKSKKLKKICLCYYGIILNWLCQLLFIANILPKLSLWLKYDNAAPHNQPSKQTRHCVITTTQATFTAVLRCIWVIFYSKIKSFPAKISSCQGGHVFCQATVPSFSTKLSCQRARIRHTNPKIENQIFLEFHFLPPKYC